MRTGVIIYNVVSLQGLDTHEFSSAEGVKGGAACKAKVEKTKSAAKKKKLFLVKGRKKKHGFYVFGLCVAWAHGS